MTVKVGLKNLEPLNSYRIIVDNFVKYIHFDDEGVKQKLKEFKEQEIYNWEVQQAFSQSGDIKYVTVLHFESPVREAFQERSDS